MKSQGSITIHCILRKKDKLINHEYRYINALFTKYKKEHLPSFLQGTWFDEWMFSL